MRRATQPLVLRALPAVSARWWQHGTPTAAASPPATGTAAAPSSDASSPSPGTSPTSNASASTSGTAGEPADSSVTYSSLYPRLRLRATTQERPYKRREFVAFEEPAAVTADSQVNVREASAAPKRLAPAADIMSPAEEGAAADGATQLATQPAAAAGAEVSTTVEGNEVQQFLDEVQRQVEVARHTRNQAIPFPQRPETYSPEFRRIKRHTKMQIEVPDPDYPTFARKDQAVPLPPPQEHPWVRKNTPIGPFIVHGDGQINQTGGTGQVDFDDTSVDEKLPESYRGLQHRSVLQRRVPQDNGRALQDAVIKHSFTLTGRGVFATRRVAKGETIMIVQSTARSVGIKGEMERLEEMCADILLACHRGDARAREYLHDWVLTGQPSSLIEHWPAASTSRVLAAIGGADVLDDLELHPIHVARLAAILDLNSFLVESSFSERKGMAYFPEAGFLNHSCVPNATYDIMPEHTFRDSDYYLDEAVRTDGAGEREEAQKEVEAASEATASTRVSPSTVTATPAATTPAAATPPARSAADFGSDDRLAAYPDLTEADAPVYLFCCRAERDIEAGEEVLISYVPPQWSFDNRQYVLHDRYHFWCKCSKCSPVLDRKYARVPKLIVVLVFISILLQILVFRKREQISLVEEDNVRLAAMSEEERLEELRARGINVEELTADAIKRRKEQRTGLFERLEQRRLDRLYEPENRGFVNVVNRMDPYARPPR